MSAVSRSVNAPLPSGRCAPLKPLVKGLLAWFQEHARDLPWRHTRDPYAIWVSEIMLQQTQVTTVVPYWTRWMREFPDLETLAQASEDRVLKLWEGLGYYSRARHLQRAAREILARQGGRFPTDYDAILALPGVGRYTAGAICSIAFDQATPIVDGNIIRVLTRLFGVAGDPRSRAINERIWQLAEDLVKTAAQTSASTACSACNQALMELGALVCTPRQPDCPRCPWRRACVAHREHRTAELPERGIRVGTTARHFVVFAIRHRDRWLVRQRPKGGVNAGLWEFPNVEVNAAANAGFEAVRAHPPAALAKALPGIAAPAAIESGGTIQASLTRYRLTLEIFRVRMRPGRIGRVVGEWRTDAELTRLAFSSAQRRIARRVTGLAGND